MLLTTTDGLIENQTSIAVSADGKTFYYCTNAKDIERRHIWAVPAGGGTPSQITAGEGVETYPTPLASGKYMATLSASWNMPQSVGVWKMGTAESAEFKQPLSALVVDDHDDARRVIANLPRAKGHEVFSGISKRRCSGHDANPEKPAQVISAERAQT